MDTFSLIREAVAASEVDPDHARMDIETRTVGRIVAAVQVVCDVLTPPDGGRYIVGFADIATAATSIGDRRIIVSSKPLADRSLSMVEKAVVIATFAAHEIGHTIVTAPRKGLIEAHNAKSGYHAVANIADDIILEPFMVERFPILADAFEFTGLWVLRNTAKALPKVETMRKAMTTAERFNVILSATRYTDTDDIVWNGDAACRERDWARAWRDRLIASPINDHGAFLAHCDELWDRIRSEADEDPQPPIINEPPEGPVGPKPDDEDEDEDEPKGPKPEGPIDEPTDDEPDGEDEPEPDDEGGDEPGGDKPGPKGEPKGDPKDGDPNDQPTDWDDGKGDDDGEPGEDEPDTDPGDKPDANDDHRPKDEGEGGGGNSEKEATPQRDEDDFDESEVDKTTHDQAERNPFSQYDGERAEQAVRTFASTTVTSFGIHGSMSTRWD